MGLFNLFKYTEEEKLLINEYIQVISEWGVSPSEAKSEAEMVVDEAINESKKERTYNLLPKDFGDILLGEKESNDQTINKIAEYYRKQIPDKKKEGVKDEDIRWWWNFGDIERRSMLKLEDISSLSLFMSEKEKINGVSEEESSNKAAEKVRKYHPMYGDPNDQSHTTGDNRPLPFELKNRVDIYIRKMADANPKKFRNEIESFSSFNAFVRNKMKNSFL